MEEFQQLSTFPEQLHVGEVNLLLATRANPDFLLMSGDKKCMKALYRLPNIIYKRLRGHVICLEKIVLKLINMPGFNVVCDRIKPTVQYGRAVPFCFGYTQPAPESRVREALQSCINEIPQYRTKACIVAREGVS
ncbi:MAG: hypothetical protein WBA76_06855, partial [Phormidesmis sp.]